MGRSNTTWKKGQSGNPMGRKPNSFTIELENIIKKVEEKEGKKLFEHFVERAFEDDRILIALMRKLIPDMKYVETEGKDNINTWADLVVMCGRSKEKKKSKMQSLNN